MEFDFDHEVQDGSIEEGGQVPELVEATGLVEDQEIVAEGAICVGVAGEEDLEANLDKGPDQVGI